ncbi:MAG TPA: hypothetical protein VGG98_07705 [Solirubrobacteraceae bacterium]
MQRLWRWYGPQTVGAFAGWAVLIGFGPSARLAAGVVFVVIALGLGVVTWRSEDAGPQPRA